SPSPPPAPPVGAAPAPVPAEGPRRRPLAMAAAAIGAAAAITAAVVVADYAASPGESRADTIQTAAPAATPTAPDTVAAPVPPAVQGVFAGRSSGNEMTVAVATRDGQVAAYLCDGESVEAWLEGPLSGRELRLQSRKGAVVTATLTDAAAFGSITVAGRTLPFSAEL